jgi:hypothetical protein
MSDDLEAGGHHAITHNGETYITLADAAETFKSLRAELATARRDALAEIKQDTDELIEQGRQDGMEEAAQWHDEQAAQAQKLSDMKVSAQDQKVWGDYATNHREYAAAIRAAAGEGK